MQQAVVIIETTALTASVAKLPRMDAQPPSTCLALHDGRAGNRRQALALAEALGAPFSECVLEPSAPWRWVAPRLLPGTAHAFGSAFRAALDAPPTVAIGCGRQAALATRLLRERGARAIQILDPRLPTRHWDLVIAPAHDQLAGPNVWSPKGSLNPVTPHWIADARARFPEFGARPGPRTTVLIGGPTEATRWDVRAIDSLIDMVQVWQTRDGGSASVACSRRTPAAVVRHLRRRLPHGTFIWASDADGANPYAGLLAWADRIVTTPDSANMISEAASTAAPLWIAFPGYAGGRVRRLVDDALSSGRARAFGPEAAHGTFQPWQETTRVAAALNAWLRTQASPEGTAGNALNHAETSTSI